MSDEKPSPSEAMRSLEVSDSPTSGTEADAADGAVDEATESHQAAEGVDATPSITSTKGFKQAILRTSPSRPLHEVESPWDPDRGGITRIYRGLQKMLDFEGTPAIVDLVVGAAEWAHRFEPEGGEDDEQQEATDEEAVLEDVLGEEAGV